MRLNVTQPAPGEVYATSGSDLICIVRNPSDSSLVDIYKNNSTSTPTQTQALGSFTSWRIIGADGNDHVIVDYVNTSPLPSGGLQLDASQSGNSLRIVGTSGADTITVGATQVTVGGQNGAVRLDQFRYFSADLGAGDDRLVIDGATVRLNLVNSVSDGTSVTVQNGGTLDLGGGQERIHNLVLAGGSVHNGTLVADNATLE